MKISIRTLSRLSGFSPATVSNALNNRKGVNPQTAETILRLAKEHGYESGPTVRTDVLRMLVFRNESSRLAKAPFIAALIDGVAQAGASSGFSLQLVPLDRESADYGQRLAGVLSDASTGILVLATDCTAEDFQAFEACEAPLVYLDNSPAWVRVTDETADSRATCREASDHLSEDSSPRHDAVVIDNVAAIRSAVRHLYRLGHRHIGHIQSDLPLNNNRMRLEGYLSACRELAIEPTVIPANLRAHLQSHGRENCPTAFVADNDYSALEAVGILREFGLSVPGDVSVIGFDDSPFCEMASPPLSSMRVPIGEMGASTVRQLLGRLRASVEGVEWTPVTVLVPARLVERGSAKASLR